MSEEKEYYLEDVESGIPYKVTKEYHEWYLALWEQLTPKATNNYGKLYMFGTGGDIDKNDFNKFWEKEVI